MPKKVLTFSLDETMVDAVDVLAHDQSRTEWLRNQIRSAIERRLTLNEMAITQFYQLAVEAGRREQADLELGDAEGAVGARKEATEYRNLVNKYEAEKLILYGARGGV